MKKEEWVEAFVEIYGYKPSPEELQAAKEAGEFVEEVLNEPTSSSASEGVDPVLEFENTNEETKQEFVAPSHESRENGSANIQYIDNTLVNYLKFCYEQQKWPFLIYFAICVVIGIILGGLPGIFAILISMFLISESGQNLVCKFIGAKQIERQDYIEKVNRPIAGIIAKARRQGLILPENIEIRIIQNELPTAYAVGMNRIVISESLLENPQFLESKIMFELHRIHNMAPNLLLVVVGVNLLIVFIGFLAMLFGGFNKNYGDRRRSFWTGSSQAAEGAIIYYGTMAILAAILSLTFLFIKSVVKRDVELSDKFMASQGLGQMHCLYLDKVNVYNQSRTKKIFELGFPDKDKRIATMQNEYGVNYYAN
ncbi:hypothetical protein HO665_06980 [Streptococcus suis]|nr:hypothetical protein [Streptococcus suis]